VAEPQPRAPASDRCTAAISVASTESMVGVSLGGRRSWNRHSSFREIASRPAEGGKPPGVRRATPDSASDGPRARPGLRPLPVTMCSAPNMS